MSQVLGNAMPLNGKRILLVEDESDLRAPLVEELTYLGCQVQEANNAIEAAAKLKDFDFDLVISDIRMPGGDGISLLRQLRESRADHPPFLLISGYSDFSRSLAFHLGADGIVPKPFDMNEIEAIIRTLLTSPGERWISASPETLPHHLQLQFPSLAAAMERGEFLLGRGGFFLAENERFFSPGRMVSFEIQFNDSDFLLKGTAQVAWVRSKIGGQITGMGLEFSSLTPESASWVDGYIRKNRMKSFIPDPNEKP